MRAQPATPSPPSAPHRDPVWCWPTFATTNHARPTGTTHHGGWCHHAADLPAHLGRGVEIAGDPALELAAVVACAIA
jgi:hypothetical protein